MSQPKPQSSPRSPTTTLQLQELIVGLIFPQETEVNSLTNESTMPELVVLDFHGPDSPEKAQSQQSLNKTSNFDIHVSTRLSSLTSLIAAQNFAPE